MNSFELFEMTMEKINNQKGESKETLKIKEELRNNGLPKACKMLHEFISNLDDKCFEDTFPITYGFDNGKREKILGKSNQRKISAAGDFEEISVGDFKKKMRYFACFSDEGKKTKTKICCSRCDANEYVYGGGGCVLSNFTGEKKVYEKLGKKAELDHFLTRLLFEEALDKKTALGQPWPPKEAGLFILAAEVMGKEELAKELKAKVEEGNKDKEERIKDNIRKIIEETNYTRDNE